MFIIIPFLVQNVSVITVSARKDKNTLKFKDLVHLICLEVTAYFLIFLYESYILSWIRIQYFGFMKSHTMPKYFLYLHQCLKEGPRLCFLARTLHLFIVKYADPIVHQTRVLWDKQETIGCLDWLGTAFPSDIALGRLEY